MTQCQTRVDKLFFGDASRSDREKESRFQAVLKLTHTLMGLDSYNTVEWSLIRPFN